MNMFKPNSAKNPEEYISKINEPRKSEIQEIHNLIIKTVPKLKPFMISGMIGYGPYHFKYASGREGDWCVLALASQKNYISVYACMTSDNMYIAEKYKNKFPKANIGKSCIRFKKLSDIDLEVLKDLLVENENAAKSLNK